MLAISWYAIMLWYFMYLFLGFGKCNVRNTVQWNKIRNCGKVWKDRISFRNNGGLYYTVITNMSWYPSELTNIDRGNSGYPMVDINAISST